MSKCIDFNVIKLEHHDIHCRLLNWAHWCRGSSLGSVHPMFRQYRNGYFQHAPAASYADTVDAVSIQRAMKDMPEPQRIAIQWFYVKPGSPAKVCGALGVSKCDLLELVHKGREAIASVAKVATAA